jgi:hypothetical protein
MKMTLLPAIAALVACGSRGHSGRLAPPDSAAGDADRLEASVDASLDGSEAGSASDAAEAAVPVDPICTPRSGTRIKVRWYQSAEGTRVFDSMYDSMLDVRCQPALTSDGKVRCLPLEQLSVTPWYSDAQCTMFGALDQTLHLLPNVPVSNGFADSTCMAPATGVSSDTCPDARFAWQYDDCSGVTVYSVGAALDAGFQQELQPDGGYGCNPVAYDMETWHAVDAFPQAAIGQVVRHPVGAGRLQYLTYEADGQFRWRQRAAFDSQTGTPCVLSWLPGATTRCLPTPARYAILAFTDANCAQPMYIVNLASCAAPGANAIASAYDTCQRVKIVHVGPPYNGVVYEGSAGACFLSKPPPGTVVYQGIDDIDQACTRS